MVVVLIILDWMFVLMYITTEPMPVYLIGGIGHCSHRGNSSFTASFNNTRTLPVFRCTVYLVGRLRKQKFSSP